MTIKNLIPAVLIFSTVALTLPSCKNKVPDTEVKSKVENVVIPGVTVDVKDGIVTLNGTVSNEADKAMVENNIKALDTKESGVKSVINNIVVVPAPAPVVNDNDALLASQVVDATKDFPTVTASVKDGIITVTGELDKAKVQVLKMALDNLKPKKTDMSALKVK
jgi:hyperosmotically inducible protein